MKKHKIIIKSTFIFDKKIAKKIAKRMINTHYSSAQESNNRNLVLIEREKQRLGTPKLEIVTKILKLYKDLGSDTIGLSPMGKVLTSIYRKNKQAALNGDKVINSNLISIISDPETLLLAYREIKGNKGTLTPGAEKTIGELKSMNEAQLKLYYKTNIFPDGFNIDDLFLTSQLIRKQLYPWGISSRVYVDKPRIKEKKRPITIPPFMDRVVQKAIELVLHSIYEPIFEKRNRSFGFRPNKGVHDAIAVLRSKKTNGFMTALEGDVEAAYDTVDKNKLLEILGKRIKDAKFLNFMKQRLNYIYVEKESENRVNPPTGLPQGGIDSPYLYNIYMHEFDEFVHTDIQTYINQLNNLPHREAQDKRYRAITNARKHLLMKLKGIKTQLKETKNRSSLSKDELSVTQQRRNIFITVRAIRLNHHMKNKVSSIDNSKRILKYIYVRYSDDWILLTNGSPEVANTIKRKIADFLWNVLKLKLSEKKTLITNITKNAAHFLGFEIRRNISGIVRRFPLNTPNSYKKDNLKKSGGVVVWAAPDRQRLINRLHMKGFCTKNGFPISIPWLTIYEPHVIIERFNASLRGLAQFYFNHIRNNGSMYRWIYILRYSCLKTLANKYKTSITKIFYKHGHNQENTSTQTVRFKVLLKLKESTFEKTWQLLTYKDLAMRILSQNYGEQAIKEFWKTESGNIGEYPLKKGRVPKVTNMDYLDAISWVSLRTQASFDMPCASCGTFENIQMHPIKHIRKTAYVLIPEEFSYQRIMQLRNRKQIPICESCYKKIVHTGKYSGPKQSFPH